MTRSRLQLSLLLLASLLPGPAMAESDVDQADSLRFQQFFEDKSDSIKVWRETDGKIESGRRKPMVKTYEEGAPAGKPAAASAAPPAAAKAPVAKAAAAAPAEEIRGLRYEIRERYTLDRSDDTPYSALHVVTAMHKQMAGLCPNGWRKYAERSEPVGKDFFLYYELECL
ncbi:hypothetical protein [Azoarcus indigens]|uniref:DUF4893 domain-containing protein n=1 Tax=Azoarcus indigens TaxID=29545 RepID=A0A4R6E781_9RHOO|nr:hypothetical protein [Azoarcus indigens]TDN53783.1 hypothetical protein C7389_104137 [Azoarcus indigens]